MTNVIKILGFFALLLVIALLMAFPTMWLWNGVVVDVIEGVEEITFLQALGLNILSNILFKSTNTSQK
jgi:hypothetical protein